jgi:hypothetical protein
VVVRHGLRSQAEDVSHEGFAGGQAALGRVSESRRRESWLSCC